MSSERLTLIADAAIALIAEHGARGLTHRAVDAQAGLPVGSTSFYCRSRADLLTAALRRHAELDLADLQADGEHWPQGDPTLPRLIDSVMARIADWLSPAKRPRLAARFELFLIAARDPVLQEIVAAQRERFRVATVEALRVAGVTDPVSTAPLLMMAVDGILLWQVVNPQATLDVTHGRTLLTRAVQAPPP